RVTTQTEPDRLWTGLLGEEGRALMPLGDYGFGPFGWLNDRYGVSWQLNLVAPDPDADGGEAGTGPDGAG
ncbi:VOC family protein, partial [Catellatospora coxensis]|uniref:VOC family protein n=1 Tax=Catellatospora coxensis TaxID=310354 RepID=UPI0031DE0265